MLSDYLAAISFGAVGMMLYSLFMGFLQMNNRTDLFRITLGVMIISNFALDILFVSKLNMGMWGLGLATTVSNLLSALIAALGVIKSKRKPVVYFMPKQLCFNRLPEMTKLGSTQIVFNLTVALRAYILNIILMSTGGTNAVAVMTVLNLTLSFIGMIPTGASNTVLSLGSIFNGEKNRNALENLLRFSIKVSTLLSIVAIIAVSLFAPFISEIFYQKGTEVENMTIVMLRIVIWWSIFFINKRNNYKNISVQRENHDKQYLFTCG